MKVTIRVPESRGRYDFGKVRAWVVYYTLMR